MMQHDGQEKAVRRAAAEIVPRSERLVRNRRVAGHIRKFMLGLGAAGVLLLGGGFLWFVCRVPAEETRISDSADGIVALAGGAHRIIDAIELLASGRGRRLLISGANPSTNSAEISRLKPEFAKWVR